MDKPGKVAFMPPENGNKMLELEERVNGVLKTYLQNHVDKQEADLIARANMTLYNLAQSRGISLWKLCFEVMPQWESQGAKLNTMQQDAGETIFDIDYELRLVPIVIDWEHGPGYWEKKYRDLRERVAGLLKDTEQE